MLQELFNVLDLPGSSVRDVLAGQNPFDQWTSPLSDDHRTSGAKLVSQWTGADENGWGGMIGGMGAEMLLDPMNLLPGFGVMKRALAARRVGGLNRGIRAANEAQQALDAGRYGYVNAKRLAGGAEGAVEAAGPLQQRLLGYDPGVTENYQSISHGTSNPFAGSDDFPAGKLDLQYMGTGEGNQAFGWGSYSAQNPGVAAEYKQYGGAADFEPNWSPSPRGKALMRRAARLAKDPQALEQLDKYAERTVPWHTRDSFVQRILEGAARDPVTAQDALLRFGGGIPPALDPSQSGNPTVTDLWRFQDRAAEVPQGPFHLQLNLPKEAEDRMIRGDVPLPGQPPLVQQALREVQQDIGEVAGRERPRTSLSRRSPIAPPSIEKVAGTDLIKKTLERVYREGGLQDPMHIAANLDEREVPKKVAEYLQLKGIVGNKFLDRSSRLKYQGTPRDITLDMSNAESPVLGSVQKLIRDATEQVMEESGTLPDDPDFLSRFQKKISDWRAEVDEDEVGQEDWFMQTTELADKLVTSGKVKVGMAPRRPLEDYTSNYAIWDQSTLDKTRIRKVNGVNIPLANMLKGGRVRPTEAALDLVQSTQPMGSPLMKELPVPSLLSRKEALAMGLYNVAARGGFTVE